MDILDRFWGQRRGIFGAGPERVVEALDLIRVQGFQPDRAERRLNVLPDLGGVGDHRKRFDASQILRHPGVQPLAHGDLAGLPIGTRVDLCGGGLHLLADLLLGLSGKGFLHLLSGSGVKAHGEPRLPIGIGLSVAGDGLFPDAAGAGGIAPAGIGSGHGDSSSM